MGAVASTPPIEFVLALGLGLSAPWILSTSSEARNGFCTNPANPFPANFSEITCSLIAAREHDADLRVNASELGEGFLAAHARIDISSSTASISSARSPKISMASCPSLASRTA